VPAPSVSRKTSMLVSFVCLFFDADMDVISLFFYRNTPMLGSRIKGMHIQHTGVSA
jgi:hypothetical protein